MSPSATPSISIVIPVLNAGAFLPTLLPALLQQKPTPPAEILIVDSNSSDNTVELATRHDKTRVIPAGIFSHGGTRNYGAQQAQGSIVVFVTQDAIPANDRWLQELIAPFENPRVAATFSRQVPRSDANPMEQFFLATHFPQVKKLYRTEAGQAPLTFQKEVFFSNVGSAIRRDMLLKHPFDPRLIMSEDQQFARDIIQAGFAIAYAPDSVVIHSHNYTCLQAFRRYFDSVYSLTQIFPRHDLKASVGMGTHYLRQEVWMMLHHPSWLFHYTGYVFAKTLGTILGHFADKLPLWILKRVSLHAYYWTTPNPMPDSGSKPMPRTS